MNKLFLTLVLLYSIAGFAQDKITPVIQKGSRLNYTLLTRGQAIPFTAVIDSMGADYVRIGWSIEGMGSGGWVMKRKSLETARNGYWSQPTAGTDEELGEEAAVLLISKQQWNSLQQDKKFVYNDATFTAKAEQTGLKIGGKIIDAILVEGPGGNTRLWILNNPTFPALVKVEGNPHGVDLDLNTIE